jgi:uncharacterized protein involved in high-affinity Fe2+ transport
MKKFLTGVLLGLLAVALSISLIACDNNSGGNGDGDGDGGGDIGGGFDEYPLGDDHELWEGQINVAGVYFQAVDMMPSTGLAASQADAHMEADISALAGNKLGFGAGDFVPFLTVRYEIYRNDHHLTLTQQGTFMQMNASDGPHYGANVIFGTEKGQAGTYTIKFIIEPPGDNFLVHTDPLTGVTGRLWETALEVEWEFDFMPFTD